MKHRYDEDDDNDYLFRDFDDDEGMEPADDEDELPAGYTTGESGVEISMEIDEKGHEVWFAQDSRIPGSTSMGHSLEEAVGGIEDRRRQYREMLRRSREKRERRRKRTKGDKRQPDDAE
jgi:hypothetical protein